MFEVPASATADVQQTASVGCGVAQNPSKLDRRRRIVLVPAQRVIDASRLAVHSCTLQPQHANRPSHWCRRRSPEFAKTIRGKVRRAVHTRRANESRIGFRLKDAPAEICPSRACRPAGLETRQAIPGGAFSNTGGAAQVEPS